MIVKEDSLRNPDCTPLGLIQASLLTREKSSHGFVAFRCTHLCLSYKAFFFCSESRYLLFLTENYSALQTLKQYIVTTIEPLKSSDAQSFEPFVLFGSNFPKDSEYTQVLLYYIFYDVAGQI